MLFFAHKVGNLLTSPYQGGRHVHERSHSKKKTAN